MEYRIQDGCKYIRNVLNTYKDDIDHDKHEYCLNICNQFKRWNHDANMSADDLYSLVVGEESIADYAESEEMENETILYMWQAILSIFLVLLKIAYQKENEQFVPQELEIIQIDKCNDFFNKLNAGMMPKDVFAYFQQEVCF